MRKTPMHSPTVEHEPRGRIAGMLRLRVCVRTVIYKLSDRRGKRSMAGHNRDNGDVIFLPETKSGLGNLGGG